jgi:hypothetical protein
MANKRKNANEQLPAPLATNPPRTGVGATDEHVEPAGIALGGDAGDVGTPRDTIGRGTGDPYGASNTPEWSTVWQGDDKPAKTKRRGHG